MLSRRQVATGQIYGQGPMSLDPGERLNPEQRYELVGGFDPDSFDDDLTNFPDYFDENG